MIELYFHTKCAVVLLVLCHFYAPFFAILHFFTLDRPQSSHFQKAIFDVRQHPVDDEATLEMLLVRWKAYLQ